MCVLILLDDEEIMQWLEMVFTPNVNERSTAKPTHVHIFSGVLYMTFIHSFNINIYIFRFN